MQTETTLDSLATMMAQEFSSLRSEFNERLDLAHTAFAELSENIGAIRLDIQELQKETRLTNQHIDRIVMPTLDSHTSHIKNLELKFT